jgi:hypothetical protein
MDALVLELGSMLAVAIMDMEREELLRKVLRGISLKKYGETVMEAAHLFWVSPGSLSRHIVEATISQIREFKEGALPLHLQEDSLGYRCRGRGYRDIERPFWQETHPQAFYHSQREKHPEAPGKEV